MNGTFQDYINYRIERAYESLADARLLADNNRWNACVNRLYYASFYIVNALLSTKNIQVKTHKGVKTKFFLEFIKTQKVDKKFSNLYAHLFDWRQETDYADFINFDKNTVLPLINQVEEFINTIKELIV